MRVLAVGLVLTVLASPVLGGEPATVSAATERGMTLDRILDSILVPREPPPPEGRTLILLLDPTPSLATAAFPAALRSALRRNAGRMADTRIGVIDLSGGPGAEPTADPAEISFAAEGVVNRANRELQDVYARVRQAARDLEDVPGMREIVLVTLENGDAERGLEKAVTALSTAEVRLSVVTRPAFLSDTWWYRRAGGAPSGFTMGGPESAFVEVPWSFVLQRAVANEAVSSGFALFGLSRLATATGGRLYLYYPDAPARRTCLVPASGFYCPVCRGNHLSCGESYETHRLRALAPQVGTRREVAAALAKDPYFQAVQGAWNRASDAGILLFRSPVEWAGGALRPAPLKRSHIVLLGDSVAFRVQENRARKIAKACDRVLAELSAELVHAEASGGSPRQRAVADLFTVMLELARFNLLQLAEFCREVGPAWEARDPDSLDPPEIPPLRPDYLYRGIGYTSMSLCHGVAPYREMQLPGGDRTGRELARLESAIVRFMRKHAHTPFAEAIRRQGIAKFYLVGSPRQGVPPPRWVPRPKKDATATPPPPPRPKRAAPSGGGTGDTPTSGGR